jgi:hypothetical protein
LTLDQHGPDDTHRNLNGTDEVLAFGRFCIEGVTTDGVQRHSADTLQSFATDVGRFVVGKSLWQLVQFDFTLGQCLDPASDISGWGRHLHLSYTGTLLRACN